MTRAFIRWAMLVAALSSCASTRSHAVSMHLEFLTRDGCAGSSEMRAHLDEALASLGQALPVHVVDVATLAASDPRTGYGTPTILVDDMDLLGATTPAPAAPT